VIRFFQDAAAFVALRFALAVMGHPGERLKPRANFPTVESAEAQSWHTGWWTGIAVGFVNGAGLVALLFSSGVLA
jgi:hypothetical protein